MFLSLVADCASQDDPWYLDRLSFPEVEFPPLHVQIALPCFVSDLVKIAHFTVMYIIDDEGGLRFVDVRNGLLVYDKWPHEEVEGVLLLGPEEDR